MQHFGYTDASQAYYSPCVIQLFPQTDHPGLSPTLKYANIYHRINPPVAISSRSVSLVQPLLQAQPFTLIIDLRTVLPHR
jgi:hypothetical protein